MNASQVAKVAGISVRTLHHYDQIGLLCPKRNGENDYRQYDDGDLDKLQQILFFKTCGFSLEKISTLLADPNFDRKEAFAIQEKYLLHEKRRIDFMLTTLERTKQAWRGERKMTQREKFSGFDFSTNPYEEEAKALWGEEVVAQSKTKIGALSPEEQGEVAKAMDDLFAGLASLRGEKPDSPAVQAAMGEMYVYFNQNFGNHYTPSVFSSLGQLYITDSRFTENIDRYGQGLAAFLARAMAIFAQNQEPEKHHG